MALAVAGIAAPAVAGGDVTISITTGGKGEPAQPGFGDPSKSV
ncbi:hypothetical protein [Streptomyces sp. NPDC002889]